MPEFEEITQSLLAPELDIFGVERDPMYIGQYMLPNRLTNAIAHLAAVEGKKSRLLTCESDGRLDVYDSAVYNRLDDYLIRRIVGADQESVLAIDPDGNAYATVRYGTRIARVEVPPDVGISTYGLVTVSYRQNQIYDILDDCYDSVNHALRTIAV